jgi:hypothetical protein
MEKLKNEADDKKGERDHELNMLKENNMDKVRQYELDMAEKKNKKEELERKFEKEKEVLKGQHEQAKLTEENRSKEQLLKLQGDNDKELKKLESQSEENIKILDKCQSIDDIIKLKAAGVYRASENQQNPIYPFQQPFCGNNQFNMYGQPNGYPPLYNSYNQYQYNPQFNPMMQTPGMPPVNNNFNPQFQYGNPQYNPQMNNTLGMPPMNTQGNQFGFYNQQQFCPNPMNPQYGAFPYNNQNLSNSQMSLSQSQLNMNKPMPDNDLRNSCPNPAS